MLDALSKALSQMPERSLRNVVLMSVLACVILFVALAVGAWFLIEAFGVFGIDWLDDTIATVGAVAVFVLAYLLFPTAANAVAGFFVERIAGAVEAKHYPSLGPGREQSLGETISDTLRFLAVALVLNILVLPLYLIVPIAPFVFYVLNGYLLGREYFEMVAVRRMETREADEMRKRYRFRIWTAGAVIAFISTIPIANLTVPVLGTAFMLHMLESLRHRS